MKMTPREKKHIHAVFLNALALVGLKEPASVKFAKLNLWFTAVMSIRSIGGNRMESSEGTQPDTVRK